MRNHFFKSKKTSNFVSDFNSKPIEFSVCVNYMLNL